ncbi:right-handed parallel beta-helix repeat-containing protein, partial [Candidatus Micrarchaeota archaeon]|nr:right-handed parallel beta-helix repeat-containing protein [Candidatus Micrarchaeota archaeon]
GQQGFYIEYSAYNNFTNITSIYSNTEGVYFNSESDQNQLTNSNISENGRNAQERGLYIVGSSDSNRIYNNYFNNTNNAFANTINYYNTSKTSGRSIVGGPYLGGNFWNNYTGSDTDGDLLGDTFTHSFDAGIDYLPLIPAQGCRLISSSGSYTLNVNVTGAPISAPELSASSVACVKIAASNVDFSCNSFSIFYNDSVGTSYGILLNGSISNVTVHNCPSVSNYTYGLYSYYSNESIFTNLTSTQNAYGLFLNSSHFNRINSSMFTSNAAAAIYSLNSDSNNFSYDVLSGSTDGLFLDGATSTRFENSNTTGNSYGIHTTTASNNYFLGNQITGNIAYGVFLVYGGTGTSFVYNNISTLVAGQNFHMEFTSGYNFTLNNLSGSDYGFWMYDVDNSIFDDNIVTSVNSDCVFFQGGSINNTFTSNDVSFCGANGFNSLSSAGNTFSSNVAANNSNNGYLIRYSNYSSITGNYAYNNTLDGFNLISSNNANLSLNNATSNLLNGFNLTSSDSTNFSSNIANLNSQYGLTTVSSSSNSLTSNEFIFNSGSGVQISGGSSNSLTSNQIHNNSNHGLVLASTSYNLLNSDSIYDNWYDGISMSSASYNNLSYLNVSHNALSQANTGISLASSSSNYFVSDNVSGNLVDGVSLAYSSTNNNFSNVAVFRNNRNGIMFQSDSNSIQSSSIYNNSVSGINLSFANYSILVSNSVYNNSGSGLSSSFAFGSNVSFSSLYNNSFAQIFLGSSGSSTLLSNNLSGSGGLSYGLLLNYSNSSNLSFNSISGNSFGLSALDSNALTSSNDHYFGNTVDLSLNSTFSSASANLSGVVFDSASGSFSNFTNVSLSDQLDSSESYSLSWSSNISVSLPSSHISFSNKYLNLTNLSSNVSIDSLGFLYQESELNSSVTYDESKFVLYRYDGSLGWVALNSSPNISANSLSYASLTNFGLLTIFENDSVAATPQSASSSSSSSPSPYVISHTAFCSQNTVLITRSGSNVRGVPLSIEHSGIVVSSGFTDSEGLFTYSLTNGSVLVHVGSRFYGPYSLSSDCIIVAPDNESFVSNQSQQNEPSSPPQIPDSSTSPGSNSSVINPPVRDSTGVPRNISISSPNSSSSSDVTPPINPASTKSPLEVLLVPFGILILIVGIAIAAYLLLVRRNA